MSEKVNCKKCGSEKVIMKTVKGMPYVGCPSCAKGSGKAAKKEAKGKPPEGQQQQRQETTKENKKNGGWREWLDSLMD